MRPLHTGHLIGRSGERPALQQNRCSCAIFAQVRSFLWQRTFTYAIPVSYTHLSTDPKRLLIGDDDLCVAAALEVEHAVVVPAVLVIADEQTLRVGGQGGLAGAGQTEEDGSVVALLIGVGRAMHGSHEMCIRDRGSSSRWFSGSSGSPPSRERPLM